MPCPTIPRVSTPPPRRIIMTIIPNSNLRAAYVHVLADALTSVLAIVGLTAAWAFGWTFIDPAVGLVGMIVILSWALSLIRTAGRVLLDTVPDPELARRIRERIETGGDRLTDLHLWQVGPGHAAMIASVVSDSPQAACGLQSAARRPGRAVARHHRSECLPALRRPLQSSTDQDEGIKPGGTQVSHPTGPSPVFQLSSHAAPIASSSAGGITTMPSLRNAPNPTE